MLKLVFLFASFVAVSVQHKVPVDVYYETLCPDSIGFVTEQLAPVYNTPLKNYMDLKLVPYGKSNQSRSFSDNSWDFNCHHGPVECYGNKVQGCIIDKIPNKDDQMKYITCLLKEGKKKSPYYPIEGCIAGEDLATTKHCANGTDGADILAANGDETNKLNPQLKSVPTVVFNKKQNKTEQDMAISDFKKVLCSYLTQEKLSECGHPSSATSISLSIAAMFSFIVLRLF